MNRGKIYIPNYLNKNESEKNIKREKDDKFIYSYVLIDSRNRLISDNYEYSKYYYLDENPLIIQENSQIIKIKIKDFMKNDFKINDTISIENIQPFTFSDFFLNFVSIEPFKIIFNELPEYLQFTNLKNNYFCTIHFENLILEELDLDINTLFTYRKIYYTDKEDGTKEYFFKVSKKENQILSEFDFSYVKVKILFFYAYNVPFNNILDSENKDLNYHIITSKEENYLYLKINTLNNFKSTEDEENFIFGGNNVRIRKITNIIKGYTDTNTYRYELKERINNIVGVKIINSCFPCYINNITRNKNKLYFKIFNDRTIYNIQLDNGYYDCITLKKSIEEKIKNIKRENGQYFNSIVEINEKLDFFSFKLFDCKTFEMLKIDHVFFIYNKDENYTEDQILYKECFTLKDIKDTGNLNGYFVICVPSFTEYDDDLIDKYLQINTNNEYICCYLFNNVYYFPSKFFSSLKISNNVNFHHSNDEDVYLRNSLCFTFDILKNIELLIELSDKVETKDKLNLFFNIQVPLKFSLMLNFQDTFGYLFGFQNIGESSSITEESYEITNKTKYYNQDTLFSKHVNLSPYDYIYCLCDQFKNKIKSNVHFDLKDNNISIFSIFRIYKQKSCSEYIFDSFVDVENITESIDYISDLTFYFYKPNGELIDFNGLNHSFLLEFKQIKQ